jgi:hypothetical protein
MWTGFASPSGSIIVCFSPSKKYIQVEIGVWEGEFLNRNLPNSLDDKLLMLRQASVQFSDEQLDIFFYSLRLCITGIMGTLTMTLGTNEPE